MEIDHRRTTVSVTRTHTPGLLIEPVPGEVPVDAAEHERRQAEILRVVEEMRLAGEPTKISHIAKHLSFPQGSFYAEVNPLIEAGKLVKIMSWYLLPGAPEPAGLVAEREETAKPWAPK